ncbi:MAG: hypothetical protein LBE16_05615 [Clostridiales Family XIII bacterium]|nr:hypothetical protein [Clostridiales Family XIII bacterium]
MNAIMKGGFKLDTKEEKTRKTGIILGAVAGAVIIALIVAVIVLATGKTAESPAAPTDIGGRGTVVTPSNIEEIREQMNEPVQDGYYETRMNVDWVFPTAQSPSTNAYVENSPNNTRTVYFDLTLPDTNELIYSSPFIPVGAKLENFALDTTLPAGEHAAIVTYHLVDDDNQELSTVSVSVNIKILE